MALLPQYRQRNRPRRANFPYGPAFVASIPLAGRAYQAYRDIHPEAMPRAAGYRARRNRARYGRMRARSSATQSRRTGLRFKSSTYRSRRKVGGRGNIKRRVKRLEQNVSTVIANHQHRREDYTSVTTVAQNQTSYHFIEINTQARLESALGNLRFHNPSVPGTLITADLTDGTFNHEISVDSIHSRFECKNSYGSEIVFKVYACRYKKSSDLNVSQAIIDGLTDRVIGNGTNDPLIYPTDSEVFSHMFDVKSYGTTTLAPGETRVYKYDVKRFKYNPSKDGADNHVFDIHAKPCLWLIRLSGAMAHDATDATKVGQGTGGIDTKNNIKYHFSYDAGVNLDDISVDYNGATFTSATADTGAVKLPANNKRLQVAAGL